MKTIEIIKLDESLSSDGFKIGDKCEVTKVKQVFTKQYPSVIAPNGNVRMLYPGEYKKVK